MITADALARALGCTLADLEDLDGSEIEMLPLQILDDAEAGKLSARWMGAQK